VDVEAKKARDLERWQRRLLPFAIASIALMAIFFFVSSLIQLGRLSETIAYKSGHSISEGFIASERANPALATDGEHLRWKTLVMLEEEALARRYTQVNATLMLRAWTRHLGFLTGMILAFVGAIFILAKLSESETQLSLEGTGAKGALATSSPGLVLAVLGTALMIVTLTANFEFSTRDLPVYLPGAGVPAEAALPPPAPLDTGDSKRTEEQDLFPEEETNGSTPADR